MGPLDKLENLMKESKRVGDLYHKATSGKRGHGLGSPSVTKWVALITELSKLERGPAEEIKALTEHRAEYFEVEQNGEEADEDFTERFGLNMKRLSDGVRLCRVETLMNEKGRVTCMFANRPSRKMRTRH